jgi:hypothetical protein
MGRTSVLGWSAVALSTAITCLWAFWGVFEAFHEGWYFKSLVENLACTAQYLTLMMIFFVLSVIPLRWPSVGAILYGAFSICFFVWIWMTRRVLNPSAVFGMTPVTLPPLVVGILFWKGRPKPVSLAYKISVLFPLLIAAICAIAPIFRIASRVDDGDRGMRLIEGNAVKLIWAPEGPGWPNPDPHDRVWKTEWRGPTWDEAKRTCRYLTADGRSLVNIPQDIWRLPTAEEVVRSMVRHGKNCGGIWNPATAHAFYSVRPDKKSPLWNPYSVVIYWWTSSERDNRRAYYVDFNGNVYPRNKESNMGSHFFRAVKDPRPE